MLALALGSLAVAAPAVAAGPEPRVTIAMLPRGTMLSTIAAQSKSIAVGALGAGLGTVSPDQTYLDISQGNRLGDSLYPFELPFLAPRAGGVNRRDWRRVRDRAEEAPAQIVPGLLAGELEAAGVEVGATPQTGDAALIAVAPDGSIARRRDCRIGRCPGVTVIDAGVTELSALVRGLRGQDLLIVLERASPLGSLLAAGVAGAGFSGRITSPTTRIDGYAISTDLAPTILSRYGIPVPSEMSGRPLESTGGEADVGAVLGLSERLAGISERRQPVIGINLIVWIGLVLLATLARGPAGARWALAALAVTITWVPGLLLLGAALEPSLLGERLIVGIGAPLLAVGTILALARRFGDRAPFAAFALGAAVSIIASAADVLAGSSLTSLSLLGPNPVFGVRFFGIGNELEAVLGVLLALGAGAGVTAARPADPRRAVTLAAGIAAAAAVLVFAPGRWGADVGAAITFPAAAGGVALAATGLARSRIALVIAAPLLALASLIALDLLIGGDAHLSRSVLQAGGLDELGEVIERRTRLGARSFERFFESPYFAAALVLMLAGIVARERIWSWFSALPAARAGFVGGISAGVLGALVNDSGALLLMVATAFLAAFAGLAWADRARSAADAAPASRSRSY
jgi:hypothetical protein